MIYVKDDFFTPENFNLLQDYANNNEFNIVTVGEKSFSVLETPKEILPLLQIDGYEIILSFIRNAYKGFDADPRIHCDHFINGHKSILASVIYLNEKEDLEPNGTCFYSHKDYGIKAPEDLSNEEFDRLILEDSNDLSKWEETGRIYSVPNRILVYASNYFHSKFPFEIEQGERRVMVNFYKQILKK